MTRYNSEIEAQMCLFFSSLKEKEKRHYAAQEAEKLGYGGKKYIGILLGISQARLRRGIKELKNKSLFLEIPLGKQRREGGGRKKKEVTSPCLVKALKFFIEERKAGSPTDSKVYWIHLKPKVIAELFYESTGDKVSHGFVKRILKDLGYKYRKLRKTLSTGSYSKRNEQFEIIFHLVGMVSLKTPIISIDCKKKEELGNLHRTGKSYSTAPLKVYDHDYSHLSKGKVIPHGIYDLQRNEGYISIGSSHETADFIKDNLLWWWDNFGIHHYPDATTILILCDAGGANSYRHHAFKKQMLLLARQIGINILISHYPPYASKWNPIEHRLFAHVHHAIKGSIFTDYNFVKELMAQTRTDKGLNVHVRLNLKNYQIGLKTHKSDVDFSRISFNKKIPKLSYLIAA